MEILIVDGTKGPGDKKVLIRAHEWTSPKYADLMRILDVLFENEDRLYPPDQGYKGREMLLDLIFAVYERNGTGKTLDQIFIDFKL